MSWRGRWTLGGRQERPPGAGCPVVLKELSENPLRTTPLDQALDLAKSLQDRVRSDE